MWDDIRTNKRGTRGFKDPAGTHDPGELPASGEFVVVSWLTAVGVLASVIFVAAYPAFDPAAAMLGQFP
ncbi:MAG TPA: hypothetical protein VIY68_16140 [Steroidobacteraceae bacterium]